MYYTGIIIGISNEDNLNLVTIIAITSSVCFVLVVSALIISFIIGFTCGHRHYDNKNLDSSRAKDNPDSHHRSLHQTKGYPNKEALYECPDMVGRVKHEPEMEENVAYAPLRYFQD